MGYKIVGKFKVSIPEEIVGILTRPNPNCVSNHEYVKAKFHVESREPLKLRCHYCERTIEGKEILGNL